MTGEVTRERVVLKEGNVQITNKRAVLGSKTYSMANITSVSNHIVQPNRVFPIVLIGLGALAVFLFLWMLLIGQPVPSVLVLGLFLGGGGFLWIFVVGGPKYVVRIGSASGEVNALFSKDKDLINRIVKAINDAIVMRS